MRVPRVVPLGWSSHLIIGGKSFPTNLKRHLRCALGVVDWDLATGRNHHLGIRGRTDGQLLEEYISRRNEAALAALVQRHGPMVWGVCRRILHNYYDAEDAFQATFLVLVRKAASVIGGNLPASTSRFLICPRTAPRRILLLSLTTAMAIRYTTEPLSRITKKHRDRMKVLGRGTVMWYFVCSHWSFLPYLALVGFLTVMSLAEKPAKMDVKKTMA